MFEGARPRPICMLNRDDVNDQCFLFREFLKQVKLVSISTRHHLAHSPSHPLHSFTTAQYASHTHKSRSLQSTIDTYSHDPLQQQTHLCSSTSIATIILSFNTSLIKSYTSRSSYRHNDINIPRRFTTIIQRESTLSADPSQCHRGTCNFRSTSQISSSSFSIKLWSKYYAGQSKDTNWFIRSK